MSVQEASWKIKWALDRIDLALERMNETKHTVPLLLAAGGKGGVSIGGGGGGSNDDLTNWDGTKKKDRGRRR